MNTSASSNSFQFDATQPAMAGTPGSFSFSTTPTTNPTFGTATAQTHPFGSNLVDPSKALGNTTPQVPQFGTSFGSSTTLSSMSPTTFNAAAAPPVAGVASGRSASSVTSGSSARRRGSARRSLRR
jgi:hypothetical protein